MTDSLIKRLEAAEEGSEALDMAIEDHLGLGFPATTVRYSRSLDAALTLVPEGRFWYIDSSAAAFTSELGSGPQNVTASDAATPALSLCSAALKARKAVG